MAIKLSINRGNVVTEAMCLGRTEGTYKFIYPIGQGTEVFTTIEAREIAIDDQGVWKIDRKDIVPLSINDFALRSAEDCENKGIPSSILEELSELRRYN